MVSIGALVASSGMEDAGRLVVWGAIVVGSIVLVVVYILRTSDDWLGIRPTDSMVERYGLFIIIVLGEVVFGVVDGLQGSMTSTSGRSRRVFWGSASPSVSGGATSTTSGGDCHDRTAARSRCGFTASSDRARGGGRGGRVVSLIEHAGDARTPEPTSWLLAGSVSAC